MTTYALSAEAAEFYESTFVPALFGPWAHACGHRWSPGDRVLDVACGTGAVARAAADAAGATGEVVGVDVNDAMLAVARRAGRTFLAYGGRAVPAVRGRILRLGAVPGGLMFFGDRVAALREMGRVAGRVGLQVPGRLSHSPGYQALADVDPAARELVSGYFAVGEPDLLRSVCDDAGLTIETFETWTGATRLGSVSAFLDVELLPMPGGPAKTGSSRPPAPPSPRSSTKTARSPYPSRSI